MSILENLIDKAKALEFEREVLTEALMEVSELEQEVL